MPPPPRGCRHLEVSALRRVSTAGASIGPGADVTGTTSTPGPATRLGAGFRLPGPAVRRCQCHRARSGGSFSERSFAGLGRLQSVHGGQPRAAFRIHDARRVRRTACLVGTDPRWRECGRGGRVAGRRPRGDGRGTLCGPIGLRGLRGHARARRSRGPHACRAPARTRGRGRGRVWSICRRDEAAPRHGRGEVSPGERHPRGGRDRGGGAAADAGGLPGGGRRLGGARRPEQSERCERSRGRVGWRRPRRTVRQRTSW